MTRLLPWLADWALGDGTVRCRMKIKGVFRAAVTEKPLAHDRLVAARHNNPLPAWLLHPEAVEVDALGVGAAVDW